jgi:hypothetical protein
MKVRTDPLFSHLPLPQGSGLRLSGSPRPLPCDLVFWFKSDFSSWLSATSTWSESNGWNTLYPRPLLLLRSLLQHPLHHYFLFLLAPFACPSDLRLADLSLGNLLCLLTEIRMFCHTGLWHPILQLEHPRLCYVMCVINPYILWTPSDYKL